MGTVRSVNRWRRTASRGSTRSQEQKSSPDRFAGLFEVGRNCEAVAHASRAAFLVDGEAYFSAFMRAAERAERSILILAWDFDSRTGLSYREDGKAQVTMGDS
jgi:phosphatidylserine/phosphatidylglycerophosphate/cardiolipin synthase-like enzyme